MADTYTTNLNLTKPEPGAAEDTWGISLNADLDALDAIFGSGGTAVSMGVVTLDGLTVDGADVFFNSGWIKSNSSLRIDIDNDNNQTDRAFFISHGNASRDVFKASESGDISFYDDTGSTQGLFWDASAESLGIGTTSPSRKVAIFDSVDGYNLELSQTGAYNSGLQSGIVFTGKYNTGNNVTNLASIRGGKENTTNWDFGGNLRFYTRTNGGVDTERLRINSSGNVGIGTNSPTPFKSGARVLEIKDDAGSNDSAELILTNNSSMTDDEYVGSLIFKNTDSSGTPNHFAGLRAKSNSTFGRMDLEFYAGRSRMEDGTPDMVIIPNNDNQANVGIGTTSPSSTLEVNAPASNGIKISSTAPYLFFNDTDTAHNYDGSISQSGTTLYVGGATPAQGIVFRNKASFGESARFDTSGNLLVGTTNASGSTAPDNSSDTNNAGLRLSGSLGFIGIGSNSQPTTYLNRIGSDGDIAIFKKSGTTVGSIGTNSGQLYIGNEDGSTDTGLLFGESGTTARAIIPARADGSVVDGALDLGYSSGRFKDLHLSGTAYTGGYIRGSSSDANKLILKASSSTTELHAAGGTGLIFKGNGDNERARFDSSGNFGIGTSSPTETLHVMSGVSNDTVAIISGSQSDRGLTISTYASDGRTDGGVDLDAYKSFKFTTDGTERVRIDSSGKIGIGTTSPSTLLHLQSTDPRITLTDTSLSGDCNHQIRGADQFLELSADTGNTQAGSVIKFSVDGSEAARFDSSGNFLVGTTSQISAGKISVAGGTSANGITATTSASAGYTAASFQRTASVGTLVQFKQGATEVGSIGTVGDDVTIGTGDTGLRFRDEFDAIQPHNITTNGTVNGVISLGKIGAAFKDLHLSGTANVGTSVGIGTTNPAKQLHVYQPSGQTGIVLSRTNNIAGVNLQFSVDSSKTRLLSYGDALSFWTAATGSGTNASEKARFDALGNLLVGTTSIAPYASTSSTAQGIALRGDLGFIGVSRPNNSSAYFNRAGTDGAIINLRKDGTTVGNIGCPDGANGSQLVIAAGTGGTNTGVGLRFTSFTVHNIIPCYDDGSSADNHIDLGNSGARFDDIYATNGTIQTSDRNEKQDIQALTDAEQRVATACKGLIRRFRWQDAVEEKGDDARLHFGVMAQDLQDAFEAEGLDAGNYGMFISSTWEDDDGVEQTRLGVRYNELLAFIITTL